MRTYFPFLLTGILLAVSAFSTSAQVQKQKISLYPFSHAENIDVAVATKANQYVYQSIITSPRVELVDRDHQEILAAFREAQSSANESAIQKNSSPDLVLTGSLLNMNVKEKQRTNKETGEITVSYECTIGVSVKIIDLNTSKVYAADQFIVGDDLLAGGFKSLLKTAKTPEAAVENAIIGIQTKVDKFLQKQFKIEAMVVEIVRKQGRSASVVLVSGGSAVGFKKNQKLSIKVRSPQELPNGKTLMRTREIGLVKIDQVDDENFSTCTVIKGGTEITNAVEKGSTVICLTKK